MWGERAPGGFTFYNTICTVLSLHRREIIKRFCCSKIEGVHVELPWKLVMGSVFFSSCMHRKLPEGAASRRKISVGSGVFLRCKRSALELYPVPPSFVRGTSLSKELMEPLRTKLHKRCAPVLCNLPPLTIVWLGTRSLHKLISTGEPYGTRIGRPRGNESCQLM